jgi:phosphate transport system substrate-binding protein
VNKARKLMVGLLTVAVFGMVAMAGGQVDVNGSTTVQPIANLIQNWFLVNNPNINIVVEATGSGDGIAALINGECDIAMHSRAMKTSEYGQAVANGVFPVIYTVARDKIAVAVNESNPISNITMDQLYGIWMGTITNWSELGGNDATILFGSRDTSSGTFGVWKELVLDEEDYTGTNVTVVASNAVMQETIASEPNAIGYVGLAYTQGVKVITVNGLGWASSDYPIGRALFISTNGVPTGEVATVVDAFMGLVGNCAAQAAKYIPVWPCDCDCSGVLPE